ncbi:MAG TPA: VWA domain-containing protein [Candidatus Eisenbacteria bacterium]
MRWESPWALLLLLLLPALVWRQRRVGGGAAVLWVRSRPWGARVGAQLVRIAGILPWLAIALAIVAMARPQQGVRLSETEARGVDIMLAIDISPSMQAMDFQPRDRLFVAKQTAREFINERTHDRVGLVGFAATAFTQSPLTLDHDAVLELLDQLDFHLAEDGTAIGMALATSVARLRDSKTPSKVIVLLTDGANNRGAIDPLTGADLARAYGIKVYAILVGRGGEVPVPVDDPVMGRRIVMMPMEIDEPTLREIAKRTGGRFFRATDAAALKEIYGEINRLERAPIRSIEYREYRDLGPWVLGIAVGVLGLGALSGATWAFRLP